MWDILSLCMQSSKAHRSLKKVSCNIKRITGNNVQVILNLLIRRCKMYYIVNLSCYKRKLRYPSLFILQQKRVGSYMTSIISQVYTVVCNCGVRAKLSLHRRSSGGNFSLQVRFVGHQLSDAPTDPFSKTSLIMLIALEISNHKTQGMPTNAGRVA